MRRLPGTAFVGVVALACLLAAPGVARAREAGPVAERCGTCHPKQRAMHVEGIHAGEGVGCVGCHGGNADATEAAPAHSGTFKGKLTREGVPALCASCHADVKQMRAYGLPTDQYALYQQSGHGMKLREGDRRVAVCTDCHGSHDIRSPKDPEARTFVTNLSTTCGRCHGEAQLLKERRLSDTHAEYNRSVHARALLERGGEGAPSCVTCHGVHSAAPPELGDVHKICGTCHEGPRVAFEDGPHAEGMKAKGQAECSACHGSHDVQAIAPADLPFQCARCHAPMTKAAILGRRMGRQYAAVAAEVERAEAAVARASAIPMRTEDHIERLEEARAHLAEARIASHTARWEAFAGPLRLAGNVAGEVERDLHERTGIANTWKLLLIVFWFYVLGTAYLVRRARRPRAGG